MRRRLLLALLTMLLTVTMSMPAQALTWKTKDYHGDCSSQSMYHDTLSYWVYDTNYRRHRVEFLWVDYVNLWTVKCQFRLHFYQYDYYSRSWKYVGALLVYHRG